LLKRAKGNLIAGHIAQQFIAPKLGSGLGHHSIAAARMLMPEASVHKNGDSPSREHNIGATWQISAAQGKPKSHSVEQRPDPHFRTRIGAPDAAHIPAAPLGCQSVHRVCRFRSCASVITALGCSMHHKKP
jgi:hypothetical protein